MMKLPKSKMGPLMKTKSLTNRREGGSTHSVKLTNYKEF